MEIKTIENISGKRLSFFQLLKDYLVQIPIIQRDYAQGRPTANEIRDSFLDALYNYLTENKPNRDLDFVYGNRSQDSFDDELKFTPLDGQQRLTTLFLLHWYLANKEDKFEELQTFLSYSKENLLYSKFTYETRTSSKEFCDALIANKIKFENFFFTSENNPMGVSLKIKDCSWFFLTWETDPTIQSMLVMLDSIHSKFKNAPIGYFDRLINNDYPIITFLFLDLKEFNLSDDLYIKMNSRGVPLSGFENFKARFEQYIKKSEFNQRKSYKFTINKILKEIDTQTYFSYKIDTEWADLFWNYRDSNNIPDNQIMNFIRVTAANHYSSKARLTNKNSLKSIEELIGTNNSENKNEYTQPISFQLYKNKCFDEKYVRNLIGLLDLLTNGNNNIRVFLDNDFYYNENYIFEKVISNNLTYTQRIQFYAFYQFILDSNNEFDTILNWMRIIHNLSENTNYNGPDEFGQSINSIDKLLHYKKEILFHFNNLKNGIDGFNGQQIIEERIKANLILKNIKWKNEIIEIEKHEYFKGQIGFILNFAGILKYYNENQNCDWPESKDNEFFSYFKDYIIKIQSIFNADGLIQISDFTFERALLTKGDFLLNKGKNRSFLINRDRDISWKRFLRNNDDKTLLLKFLLDDPDFDETNVQHSLCIIIEKSKVLDWRKKFITFPNIYNYLGSSKYIRWISENEIYLLKKERMSGPHGEYYSYCFFNNILLERKEQVLPFIDISYKDVSGESDNPYILLRKFSFNSLDYNIKIYYNPHKAQYHLVFFAENGNALDERIKKILSSENFLMHEDNTADNYYTKDKELMLEIISICAEFKTLL